MAEGAELFLMSWRVIKRRFHHLRTGFQPIWRYQNFVVLPSEQVANKRPVQYLPGLVVVLVFELHSQDRKQGEYCQKEILVLLIGRLRGDLLCKGLDLEAPKAFQKSIS